MHRLQSKQIGFWGLVVHQGLQIYKFPHVDSANEWCFMNKFVSISVQFPSGYRIPILTPSFRNVLQSSPVLVLMSFFTMLKSVTTALFEFSSSLLKKLILFKRIWVFKCRPPIFAARYLWDVLGMSKKMRTATVWLLNSMFNALLFSGYRFEP